MRLKHLVTGEMTRRELISYITHLPPDSALGRAVLGEGARWTPERELQAMTIDLLNTANWQRGADPDRPGKPPTPFPRPE